MWPCKCSCGFLPGTYTGAPWPILYPYWHYPVGFAPPAWWGRSHHACGCREKHVKWIPEEISADTASPSKEALVGGVEKAELTLEYMPDAGAVSPSVKVVVTDSGGSSESNLAAIPAGYHVKSEFASAAPGAKITLTVNECRARVRWFERLS